MWLQWLVGKQDVVVSQNRVLRRHSSLMVYHIIRGFWLHPYRFVLMKEMHFVVYHFSIPTMCVCLLIEAEWRIYASVNQSSLVLSFDEKINKLKRYGDVTMGVIASQITSLTIVYSSVYSDADQRKHQSSASLAFVRRIHRSPVNSPHKWPVTRKMFPFDDVIMFKIKIQNVLAVIHDIQTDTPHISKSFVVITDIDTCMFSFLHFLLKQQVWRNKKIK